MRMVHRFIGLWFICLLMPPAAATAQPVETKLAAAVDLLKNDPQVKHASIGLSILKTVTGEKVFELNPQTGLAPASCQKTITSAASLELLGAGYRYKTVLGYDGAVVNGVLNGNLYLVGSGDPSLGSWRYDSTKEEKVLNTWIAAIRNIGITKINGDLVAIDSKWEKETLPGGWIWDDIGNYYGAGTAALNWRENQYDLVMSSGSQGSKVTVMRARPQPYLVTLESELYAGPKGSGDNAYIYLPPFSQKGFVRGTIPADERSFTIAGSFPDPSLQAVSAFAEKLTAANLSAKAFYVLTPDKTIPVITTIHTQLSPSLDSLNYWFMKKSINLYGEAFAKTIAAEKTGKGGTDEGVKMIKAFWKEQGIDQSSLHILDGSGLSPQNRVTTDALVTVLQYAKDRPWFSYYYDALPVFNQMKLKSGTIGGAKSFAGYHTAKDGTAYTIAFIINNFDGPAGEMVKKMFKVLDELK